MFKEFLYEMKKVNSIIKIIFYYFTLD